MTPHRCSLLVLCALILSLVGSASAGTAPVQFGLAGIGDGRSGIGAYPYEFSGAADQFGLSLTCDGYANVTAACAGPDAASSLVSRNLARLQYEKENDVRDNHQSAELMFLATSQAGTPTNGDAFLQAVGAPAATIAVSSDWSGMGDKCKIPEPTSLLFVGTGLVAMAGALRRKLLG